MGRSAIWCVRVSVRESDTVDLDASTVWAFGESVGRGRGGMSRGKLTLGTPKFGTLRTALSGIANFNQEEPRHQFDLGRGDLARAD